MCLVKLMRKMEPPYYPNDVTINSSIYDKVPERGQQFFEKQVKNDHQVKK